MIKYSMTGAQDISRLEKQNDQKSYDLSEELNHFEFTNGDKVLDAGCGSGLVTRAIQSRHAQAKLKMEACDFSEIATENAAKFFSKEGIEVKTFVSDLEKIKASDNTYDKVISRYVLEHMKEPVKAAHEFYRILRPGGKVFLIDLDGILFNFHSENEKLNYYLQKLKAGFKFDLFVGRKMNQFLFKAGFTDVKWEAVTINFNTPEELKMEVENYEMRFNLAQSVITEVLGSANDFEDFKKLYLSELASPQNLLFYTKFFVTGTVPLKK
ncbi:MAG: methyltransferase domain-containing protein [Rhizobacter sp.]|nr:methyltransferase domain-containing protein [Bacteriovorax sp.]